MPTNWNEFYLLPLQLQNFWPCKNIWSEEIDITCWNPLQNPHELPDVEFAIVDPKEFVKTPILKMPLENEWLLISIFAYSQYYKTPYY